MDDGRLLSTTAADALHAESAQVRFSKREERGGAGRESKPELLIRCHRLYLHFDFLLLPPMKTRPVTRAPCLRSTENITPLCLLATREKKKRQSESRSSKSSKISQPCRRNPSSQPQPLSLSFHKQQAIAPLLNFIDPDDNASDGSLLASLAAGKWPTLESVVGGVGGGSSSNALSLLSYRVPLPPTPIPELAPFIKQHAAALNAYASRRTAEIAAAKEAEEGGGAAGLGPRLGLRQSSRAATTTATTAAATGDDGEQSGGINVPEPGEGLLRAEREIPAVFFREEFDLSSQEAWTSLLGIANSASAAFAAASSASSAAVAPSTKAVLASAADHKVRELAADRASRLACLADGALVDEVAARAPIFGAAAATLGGLRGDVAAVAALARGGGDALRATAARAAASSESAALLALRRGNLRAALAALEPLETAQDAREALSAALSLGDFNGALEALEALRRASTAFGAVDRGDLGPSPSVPLVVAALAEDVRSAEAGVRRLLRGAAAGALHLSAGPSSPGSPPSSPRPAPDSSALRAVLAGAVRGNCLEEVMEAVAATGAAEAKAAVASAAASGDDSASSSPSSIEDRLSSLADASAFELALVAASRAHGAVLRHALSCREALWEVEVEGEGGRGGGAEGSSGLATTAAAAGGDFLVRSVAAAGASKWASLLSSRPSSATASRLPEVLRLLEAAAALERGTAEALRALSPQETASSSSTSSSSSSAAAAFASSIRAPSEAASALAKAFIESFHSRARSWLVGELDGDDWLPSRVPEGVQRAVERLEGTAARGSAPSSVPLASSISASASSTTSSTPDVLVVRGAPHPTAAAGLAFAAALCEYAAAAAALPSTAGSISYFSSSSAPTSSSSSSSHAAALALRAAELAKVFNGRSCQLVLGAGALTASGGKVKAMTARRLAVASRTLGAAAAVVEVARDAFVAIGGGGSGSGGSSDVPSSPLSSPRRRNATVASLASAGGVALACQELDSAIADLQTHRAELHSKLVSLVSERCSAGLAAIAADPEAWLASSSSSSSSSSASSAAFGGDGGASASAAPPAPPPPLSSSSSSSPFPSSFARDMIKHLSSLESALAPLLSREETVSILGRAAVALSASCAEGLSSAAHKGGAGGRAQAAVDGKLLLESLRALQLPRNVAEEALAPLEAVFAPPKRRKQQQQREVVAAEEEEAKKKEKKRVEEAAAAREAAASVAAAAVAPKDDSGITEAAATAAAVASLGVNVKEAATEAGGETVTAATKEPEVVEAATEETAAAHPLSPPATLPPDPPAREVESNKPNNE